MKDGMKKVAKAEVKAHEKRMHGMKAGGKTNADMLKYGRNMAKVMNQRSPGRKGG
jgi:hypothetical protein